MSLSWNLLFVDDDRDFLDAKPPTSAAGTHRPHGREQPGGPGRARDGDPDLIFLDLMMERYDSGFRLAYQIRKHERLDGTPIVMLSGWRGRPASASTRRPRASVWSRLDRFVDKPVTGKQLLGIAEELLGGREAESHPAAGDPGA